MSVINSQTISNCNVKHRNSATFSLSVLIQFWWKRVWFKYFKGEGNFGQMARESLLVLHFLNLWDVHVNILFLCKFLSRSSYVFFKSIKLSQYDMLLHTQTIISEKNIYLPTIIIAQGVSGFSFFICPIIYQ